MASRAGWNDFAGRIWPAGRSLETPAVNHTRIENAHKVRKKVFVFSYVGVICTIATGKEQIRLLWADKINPPELPINGEARNEAHIASIGVRRY